MTFDESKYDLRTLSWGLGQFPFSGLKIEQNELHNITILTDLKLNESVSLLLCRARRKTKEHSFILIEQRNFYPHNIFPSQLRYTALPFCLLY